MSLKRAIEETFKDTNAAIAGKTFKTKDGKLNYKTKSGMNMFMANKLLKN